MTTLPAWIAAHVADRVRATFWLVEVSLDSTLYLTDCDQPIYFGGHEYVPTVLSVEGIQADAASASANGGQLKLASGGAHWQPIIAAIAGGTRDFPVTLREAWLDVTKYPSAVPPANGVRLVGSTRVEAAKWDRGEITLTLGPSADPALSRLPFREYGGGICTYRRFKGAQCGYSGSETECDRTSSRCSALGNSARFGGFPSLPKDGYVAHWTWNDGVTTYTAEIEFLRREE